MNDEDTHSLIIDIPKLRNFARSTLDNVKQKRTKQVVQGRAKFCRNYKDLCSLPAIKPLAVVTVRKDEVILPYIIYSRKQEKERTRQRMCTGLQDNYKAIYDEKRRRLHIDDPPNDVLTVTDHDPGFFTCVNGSFLSSYVAPYKSLKYLFNSQIRWRQEIGYRNDCMLNIDRNHQKEQEVYDLSTKRYMEQVKCFEAFVSADYRKSMLSLNKWEDVKLAVSQQTFELLCLAAKVFTNTSRIIGLDYRYGLQQKYGRFLYYLSPPSWRFHNRNFARSIEIEARGFDFGISSEEDTFSVMFEKLKRECYSGLVKPVLYFKHPDHLMKLFDGIEQQHLHHFTHVAALAPHAAFFRKGIKLFKDIIAQESAGTLNTIKQFQKLLKFSEDQCSQLQEKFFKIIRGFFYECVGHPEVLKFQTHLEFCYEKIYYEKPINMDMFATAKALEDVYMVYSKRLDAVTSDKIKGAVELYFESERGKYRRAKVAARELRQFERVERELLRAFAPAANGQQGVSIHVRRNSRKKLRSRSKFDQNRNTLTEAEVEYLTLFTDWTAKEDPSNYLHASAEDPGRFRTS
ncbi:hypothetical protein PYW07_013767 [Mythimna separata]|uniref:Uncharacterized protein n=1 Tax=Mythimna separata TaxID=271217 RepID=A0AAD7YEV3_MYTSE|nr:hypothetical protein PYW07_013767 [Mythimna separata]